VNGFNADSGQINSIAIADMEGHVACLMLEINRKQRDTGSVDIERIDFIAVQGQQCHHPVVRMIQRTVVGQQHTTPQHEQRGTLALCIFSRLVRISNIFDESLIHFSITHIFALGS